MSGLFEIKSTSAASRPCWIHMTDKKLVLRCAMSLWSVSRRHLAHLSLFFPGTRPPGAGWRCSWQTCCSRARRCVSPSQPLLTGGPQSGLPPTAVSAAQPSCRSSTLHNALLTASSQQHTKHCTLKTAHCTLHTEHCTLNTAH